MATLLSCFRKEGIALSAVVTLVLTACVTAPPAPDVDFNPEYNFSEVRTVALYRDSGQVTGENPHLVSDMVHDRIDLALKRALEQKGITFTDDPESADLLLSWHLVTETKTDVRTYETPSVTGGFYSPAFHRYNRYSRYSCWACMQTRTEISVREYAVGTFIVDLIDPGLGKSVWRSVTSSRLKGRLDKDQDKYDSAAMHVLADFPPHHEGP